MFHVPEVESHGGIARASGDGARLAMDRRSRRTTHLGSYIRGMLVLMPALGSCPRRERGGGQGEGVVDAPDGDGAEARTRAY